MPLQININVKTPDHFPIHEICNNMLQNIVNKTTIDPVFNTTSDIHMI